MQVRHWQRIALLASLVWVVGAALLASWNETWIAAWKLYCAVTADRRCTDATVFLVMHWNAILGVVLFPLALTWLAVWGFVAARRRMRRANR